MILDVEVGRTIVVSDLHLGSPASTAEQRLPAFLAAVERSGATLCINGDGFDLLQSSMASLIAAALPVVRNLRRLVEAGTPVLYTLGNHDLALEHLLTDLPLRVAPFLNLTSGGRRIRLEHGHVYEPFYARHPGLYEFGGRLARPFLAVSGDVYKLWATAQLALDKRRRAGDYPHHVAARMLFRRGFDAVVLGHTHHPECTDLGDGLFVNCGSWMSAGTWVDIRDGEITLHSWPELPAK